MARRSHPSATAHLAWLHPGAGASGLGTGALGTATLMLSRGFPASGWIEVLAFGLLWVALFLSVGALIIYGYRLISHRHVVWREINDPQLAPLFATLPGGLVVTAAGFAQLTEPLSSPLPPVLIGALGAVGVLLSVVVAGGFVVAMVLHGSGVIKTVTGVWFVPGTVMMLCVILLISLNSQAEWIMSSRAVTVFAGAALGVGFGMTAVSGGMLAIRLIDGGPLSDDQQPTSLIALSPLSIGAVALIALIRQLVPGGSSGGVWIAADLVATMIWGFASFWAVICIIVLVPVLRRRLTVSPSWWAFVFPVAAFAEATLRLGQVWESPAVTWLGIVVWAAEVCIWMLVIVAWSRNGIGARRAGLEAAGG